MVRWETGTQRGSSAAPPAPARRNCPASRTKSFVASPPFGVGMVGDEAPPPPQAAATRPASNAAAVLRFTPIVLRRSRHSSRRLPLVVANRSHRSNQPHPTPVHHLRITDQPPFGSAAFRTVPPTSALTRRCGTPISNPRLLFQSTAGTTNPIRGWLSANHVVDAIPQANGLDLTGRPCASPVLLDNHRPTRRSSRYDYAPGR